MQPAPSDPFGTRESFVETTECVLTQVANYLEHLKELDVFENSLIVVTGDNGSKQGLVKRVGDGAGVHEVIMSAAHPAIAIKDFGSTKPVEFSDAPVSLLDIHPTILRRLEIKASGLGPNILSGPVADDRERRFHWYAAPNDAKEDELPLTLEFFIVGDIRDPDSWRRGKVHRSSGPD